MEDIRLGKETNKKQTSTNFFFFSTKDRVEVLQLQKVPQLQKANLGFINMQNVYCKACRSLFEGPSIQAANLRDIYPLSICEGIHLQDFYEQIPNAEPFFVQESYQRTFYLAKAYCGRSISKCSIDDPPIYKRHIKSLGKVHLRSPQLYKALSCFII